MVCPVALYPITLSSLHGYFASVNFRSAISIGEALLLLPLRCFKVVFVSVGWPAESAECLSTA